ncbi:MAG: endopeptidase La [bacterium]|nr:endopeptidase La [bacterium]
MADTSTVTLPVLPLHNGVVFPHMVVNVGIESDEARRAIAAANKSEGRLLLIPRNEDGFASVGTIAEVQEVSGSKNPTALIAGVSRARIGAGQPSDPDEVLWVEAVPIAEPDSFSEVVADMVNEYRAVVSEIMEERGIGGAASRILGIDDPGQLADLAVYSPDLSQAQKVEVLETTDVAGRLELVLGWMNEILADMQLRRKVRDDASERIDKTQREFLLRQQMESIRSELGEGSSDVVGEYRQKLAERDLPEKVEENVSQEIDRLERMGEQSPEHSWTRTWLDTVFDIPWESHSTDNLDLDEARNVLDADHTGLEDVKERIVEHLAVRKLRADRDLGTDAAGRGAGTILLLAGPPGVGKTSLGESVAKALGREFVRVALGGIRDEAEIRGHRRTYVGSRPGRIVRALVEAETMNPVFLLDEMDKVGSDWRGDPSSALLEVLDPAQNHTFRDNYLEMDLDLSNILFLATANVLETIPAPLLDRTEVIHLDGYTDNEKVEIAKQHLLPRQVERGGLRPEELEVSDEAIASIVDGYTREAGVRTLERMLGKLVRKAVTKVATDAASVPVTVDEADLRDLLGRPPVHRDEAKDRTSQPGVATGLAVTGAGGDVLFVEATAMAGEPGLVLTGQLGDVMKESAQIALSYVESNLTDLGLDSESVKQRFHVHVPAGAIPKDGPSAGVTMTTALVSLLTGRKVRDNIGMTGEVTLQGRVLPIGGVKQKVLAAHRAGLTEVIVPKRNEADLDDVPEQVREEMTFHVLADVAEVLEVALAG